jgi:hypothetical protein
MPPSLPHGGRFTHRAICGARVTLGGGVAQSKTQILALLAGIGAEPRHRFGQNFMIDQNLVRLVADAGMIKPEDVVIEVGPGTGTLTEELLERAGRIVAVEIDRDLAKLLRDRFASNAEFELIEGDALAGKHELNARLSELAATQRDARLPLKLVANLPYNIASPLIIEMLIAGVELLAFTVQKEVADRLRADADNDAYGPLSVMAQMLARVEVLRTEDRIEPGEDDARRQTRRTSAGILAIRSPGLRLSKKDASQGTFAGGIRATDAGKGRDRSAASPGKHHAAAVSGSFRRDGTAGRVRVNRIPAIISRIAADV